MCPLNNTDLKTTGQRAVILDIIRAGKGHLDADDIHRRAQKKLPRLSLSTVYRTLQKFKSSGLIEERHLEDNHHHYEISRKEEHHHLICSGCGKVVEFKLPLAKIVENLPQTDGFDITGSEIQLTGVCADCQKKAD